MTNVSHTREESEELKMYRLLLQLREINSETVQPELGGDIQI